MPEGEPVPLEGGITNRNYKVRFGGDDYVMRVPGKDTNLLGIDRVAELAASQLAAEAGVAPEVAAMLEDPPCLVTAVPRGAHARPRRSCASRRRSWTSRPTCGAIHDSRQTLPSDVLAFRIVETYARTARRARGATVPHEYGQAHENARAIEAALTGPEHEPVPCHNDLLAANFLARRRAPLDRRLGVRRHGRPLLRPRQLRRQQRARTGRGGGPA